MIIQYYAKNMQGFVTDINLEYVSINMLHTRAKEFKNFAEFKKLMKENGHKVGKKYSIIRG